MTENWGSTRTCADPQGERKVWKWQTTRSGVKTSSDGECFLAENNLKGNATARWALLTTEFEWSQPCKKGRKWKKINWSRPPIPRPRTCQDLWCKLPDCIELGPTRRDRFSKDRQDLSHNLRENSGPSESEVYVVLTSLCCCFETKFRNSSKSCSTPSFIYLPNLSFINKYIFSWDLLSFFIIHLFLFMLIDVIQKFTPITFDYFIHAGSHVLHFWNKTFNIIRVNSSHLISLYESINAAT